MNLSLSRSEFKTAVTTASTACGKTAGTNALRIVASADGVVVTGTDNATTLSVPCAANVEQPGVALIDAGNLRQVLGVISDTTITIWPNKTEGRFDLVAGKTTFTLQGIDPATFPPDPEAITRPGIAVDAADLRKVVDQTAFCIAPEDNRYGLNGAHLDAVDTPEGRMLRMVATDGNRLAWAQVPFTGTLEIGRRMLVPGQALARLRKMIDNASGPVSIAFSERGIVATVAGATLHARLLEAEFPDYKAVMPTSFTRRVVVDRDVFTDGLRRVAVFASDGSHSVRFAFSGGAAGTLTLSARKLDAGDSREELSIDLAGEPITIGFNAQYMQEAVSATGASRVTMELGEVLSPCIIRALDGGNCLYVVMPIRLD